MPGLDLSLGLTQSHAPKGPVAMHKTVDARVSKACRKSDERGLVRLTSVGVGGVGVLDGAQLPVSIRGTMLPAALDGFVFGQPKKPA